MRITLLPLYSKQNSAPEHCPLGCQGKCKVKEKAPNFGKNPGSPCPLSLHQVQTCAEVLQDETTTKVIFNKGATGDGKSLAAYLPGLLNPKFRTIGLYPTIELVKDQEQQIQKYHEPFNLDAAKRVDSLYGSELARRVEAAKAEGKQGKKFEVLRRAIANKRIILTNPDIFHLITHLGYQDIAVAHDQLLNDLAQFPNLYVADEFHIFGVHQEAAILNSLLLVRHIRGSNSPARFLFTSATPKDEFFKELQKLEGSNFRVVKVAGEYLSEDRTEPPPGYRQISQRIELEFVQLEKNTDSLAWLSTNVDTVKNILNTQQERSGRGLIILNSMAVVRRVVSELKRKLEPDILVREVSGIVDDRQRSATRKELEEATQPVLIVGTSAVDVGVDFDIHLLIFEASDSATFTQRLGRLGRHKGFSTYQAFALIPGWMTWILPKLRDRLTEGQPVDRTIFRDEIIEYAFDPPREFQQYRKYWGALQSQGMLIRFSGATLTGKKRKRERQERKAVTQRIRDHIAEDISKIYDKSMYKQLRRWFDLSKDETGRAVQDELLRFRGGSELQAAVWDEEKSRFYTYDLLRLLPHAEVEVITKKDFWAALDRANLLLPDSAKRTREEFPERYIQIFLKLKRWSEEQTPFPIELECDYLTRELQLCTMSLIEGIFIKAHPQQTELNQGLARAKLLTFLVPIDRGYYKSHWDVSNALHLSPTFGLYRIFDQESKVYACAFNQDALLLEALKWKLKRCANTDPYIIQL